MRNFTHGLLAVVLATASSCGGIIGSSDSSVPPSFCWTPVLGGPQRLIRGESYQIEIAVSDCTGQVSVNALEADLSGLPTGSDAKFLLLTPTTKGTFSWTPTSEDRDLYTARFKARMGSAESQYLLELYTAAPGQDVAPTITAPDTVWAALGDTVSFSASAMDDNDEPVFWWYVDGPEWNKPLEPYFRYWVASSQAITGDSHATIKVVILSREHYEFPLSIRAANTLSGGATTIVRLEPEMPQIAPARRHTRSPSDVPPEFRDRSKLE